ncbi:MAG: ATP-binding protein [Janthinobacterium lividum]
MGEGRGSRSLKRQFTTLCLGILIPTLVFVGVLLWRYAASERVRAEEESKALSHGLAVALDREINGVLTTLQALGTSPSLQTGNLATFYAQVTEIRRLQGIHISLRDVEGRTVLTTRAPLGTVVPVPPLLAETDHDVIASGRGTVSNVFTSSTTGQPVFQIVSAPIQVDGKATFLLAASLDLDYLVDVLRREDLPHGWVGVLVDRNDIVAVRTEHQQDYAGRTTTPDFRAHASGDGGTYYGLDKLGHRALVGYARSRLTGWAAVAIVGADVVNAPLRRSLVILVALGATLGLIATGIALVIGRRVDEAMRRLRDAAEAIGHGRQIEPPQTPIAEFNQVGLALSTAGRQLQDRGRERDASEAALRDMTASLENQVKSRTAALMKTEEALRQSQKMEAVGQLTGGLAHDFNNLLTGISGSLELLGTRVRQGRTADLDRYIVAAQGASKRAAALTHRLLAFSRRQTLDPKPTDVNRLVIDMADLIRRTVGPEITVKIVDMVVLWTALVDESQLENALLNLCINARDAMPDGGRITVETANRCMDDRAATELDLPPGQYLSLSVSDTGTGMPQEVIDRAFEPFYTTKPLGQGTGLGLSMIYGFARQSGGQVLIHSELGIGSTVCLYLPRHHGSEEAGEAAVDHGEASRAEAGQTVLVVDDEPTIRMLAGDVLSELGYGSLEAEDGPSGLRILQSKARIDLLITDVGLPGGMNGRQVADAARVLRPGLKVLFITGYAENAVVGNGHLEPGMAVLTKPFDMTVLAQRIEGLMTQP